MHKFSKSQTDGIWMRQKYQQLMPDSNGWIGVWVAKSPQIFTQNQHLNSRFALF